MEEGLRLTERTTRNDKDDKDDKTTHHDCLTAD